MYDNSRRKKIYFKMVFGMHLKYKIYNNYRWKLVINPSFAEFVKVRETEVLQTTESVRSAFAINLTVLLLLA